MLLRMARTGTQKNIVCSYVVKLANQFRVSMDNMDYHLLRIHLATQKATDASKMSAVNTISAHFNDVNELA